MQRWSTISQTPARVALVTAMLSGSTGSMAAPVPMQANPPAQPAKGAAATTPAQPAARPQTPPAPVPEPYSYQPEGRRDPFVSLLMRGTPRSNQANNSTSGIAGLTTDEISVRGVLQGRGTHLAMVQGPDTKTFIVHVNDRLLDGVIKQITPQGIVVLQEVNDPLSQVKHREVRKNLRTLEEGK